MATRKPKKEDIKLEIVKDIETGLDPQLQNIVLEAREKRRVDPAIAKLTNEGELMVDVLAKLQDPDQDVEGLEVTRKIGPIVTGTVLASRIEDVRRHANVKSLKPAKRLHKTLRFSVPEINGSTEQLETAFPGSSGPLDGAGAIIGVVDFGCDFVNRNFRNPDGSTRILHLWDQRGGKTAASPPEFGYGREFSAAEIDSVLDDDNPYQSLAYAPSFESHGTHVLDIAAGNGGTTGREGVAPRADIIFVEVAAGDFEDEESFGNSRRLLEAVDYIFSRANGRPAVVNISLGTHGGPHDGSTLAEQGFDLLVQQEPGRAIVISAGNSHDRKSHASGTIESGSTRTLAWNIRSFDPTDNELEVWYPQGGAFEVSLTTPGGTKVGPVSLDQTANLRAGDRVVGRIIHREADPNNGDNHIDILLDSSLPSGQWKVELENVGETATAFHSWIERDAPRGQSEFSEADDDPSYTLGSISTGAETIVVGSYDATVLNRPLSFFTSEGPTRDGKQKPEISAPGHGILAASATTSSTTRKSGTSMAAPHVAGMVATYMAAFQAENERPPTNAEIRQAVADAARTSPPNPAGWHSRYGHGRADVRGMLRELLGETPLGIAAARSEVRPVQATSANGVESPFRAFLEAAASVARGSGTTVRVNVEVEPERQIAAMLEPLPTARATVGEISVPLTDETPMSVRSLTGTLHYYRRGWALLQTVRGELTLRRPTVEGGWDYVYNKLGL